MDQTVKKRQGLAHPAVSQTAPTNASTVAPAAASGFDVHSAQSALQQPQTAVGTLPSHPVANGEPKHVQHSAKAKGVQP